MSDKGLEIKYLLIAPADKPLMAEGDNCIVQWNYCKPMQLNEMKKALFRISVRSSNLAIRKPPLALVSSGNEVVACLVMDLCAKFDGSQLRASSFRW